MTITIPSITIPNIDMVFAAKAILISIVMYFWIQAMMYATGYKKFFNSIMSFFPIKFIRVMALFSIPVDVYILIIEYKDVLIRHETLEFFTGVAMTLLGVIMFIICIHTIDN